MKSLFSFEGRISRKTVWFLEVKFFLIFCILFFLIVKIVTWTNLDHIEGIVWLMYFLVIFSVGIILPASLLIPLVRRFHDRDKSGWWVLVALIPYVGWIWILVECGCLHGTNGPNRFGTDPLDLPESDTQAVAPQPEVAQSAISAPVEG